jgi:Domain of unknown function (DUF4845)
MKKYSFKSRQQGLSLLGLIFVGAVLALTGLVAAQVFPTYLEYQAIGKAAQKAASGSTSVAEVRATFDKAGQIDDIRSINGKDLEVTKNGDKIMVKFAYNKEIPLTGPAYLLLKYQGQTK